MLENCSELNKPSASPIPTITHSGVLTLTYSAGVQIYTFTFG